MAALGSLNLLVPLGFFLVLYAPLTICSPQIVKIHPKTHFKPLNTNYTVDFEVFYRSLKAKPCPPPTPPPRNRKPPPPSPPPPRRRSPPPPSPPPPRRSPPPPSQTSSEAEIWLKPHNDARAALGIGPLAWDNQIAATALSWANNLASRGCIMEHGGHDGMGQNLAWWSGGDASGADAVGLWVDEKQYYSYGVFPDYCQSGEQCGHYTQVIWKDTTKVGCARVRCSNGGLEFVCNYYPPGNYIGEHPY